MKNEIAAILRKHIKCDATGLNPHIASVFLTGFEEAADEVATLMAGQNVGRDVGGWRTDPAPRDGSWMWALLCGRVRKVRYWTAEQIAEDAGGDPEEYQEGFYDEDNDEWRVRTWAPIINEEPPVPPVSDVGRNVG